MDPTEFTRDQEVHCDSCSQITPSYDIVNYGSMEQGYRQLCSRCFNAEVAKLGGLEEFENLKFESRPPPIRELHARTGRWVREAAQHGQILVTDNGRTIAKLVPESLPAEVPYFAHRKRSRAFAKLDDSGKMGKGTDSTTAISEDRDDAL